VYFCRHYAVKGSCVVLTLLMSAISLMSLSASGAVRYHYTLATQPADAPFRLAGAFFPTDDRPIGLYVVVTNTSEQSVRIHWEDSAFLLPSWSPGVAPPTADRILLEGTRYVDRMNPVAPTFVPPGAQVSLSLFPAGGIYYSDVLREWVHPRISIVDGSEIGLFLTWETADTRSSGEWRWKARVEEIEETRATDTPSPREPPAESISYVGGASLTVPIPWLLSPESIASPWLVLPFIAWTGAIPDESGRVTWMMGFNLGLGPSCRVYFPGLRHGHISLYTGTAFIVLIVPVWVETGLSLPFLDAKGHGAVLHVGVGYYDPYTDYSLGSFSWDNVLPYVSVSLRF